MNEIVNKAIEAVKKGEISFCRFITANDTGTTGSHQSGFYIPKTSFKLFFDKAGVRGGNVDRFIKIKWQDDFETDNRAIYYGQGTRNEYRLTRFGRGFPFLHDEYTGSLLVISRSARDYYLAFVLSKEDEIEEFLEFFGMSPADTNSIIIQGKEELDLNLETLINQYVATLTSKFPDTVSISTEARNICRQINGVNQELIIKKPDESILYWLHTEYDLFKQIENYYYKKELTSPFDSIDKFTETANSILNRRKSRAGQSLEHHLDSIFTANGISFSHPGRTEGNKKPDFIFPGNDEYHDDIYDQNDLVFLGAKTTCKDRWRQILNEADKIPTKHLFTLQQGISKNQLSEMYESNVVLVVPETYKTSYPLEFRERILNLGDFLSYTMERQTK